MLDPTSRRRALFKSAAVLLACVACSPPEGTVEPAAPLDFIVWRASELETRNAALGTRIGPDGSARETLADYVTPAGSHRFRFIRRDADGRPEQHDAIEDVVFVQSGAGTLLIGGRMLGRTGDLGTEIEGGTTYAVAAGDVLRIPAGVPHAYRPAQGGHITYVLVRMPAYRGTVVTEPDGEAPQLEPPGFGLWRASELADRDAALATAVRADGSSRETLGDYGAGGGSHRFRFLRREQAGPPELHDDIIDVVFVRSGSGAVLVGGEMLGQSNVQGASIRGGTRHEIAAGDVLHVPARVPHQYLPAEGGHITYVLVRFPAVAD